MKAYSKPWWMAAMIVCLAAVSCSSPETHLPTDPPKPIDTLLPPSTSVPVPTASPAPTAAPSDRIWFAPNFGSRDYLELFTKPEWWSAARSRINVFQFYADNVLGAGPCPICGDNTFDAFVRADAFQKLTDWGLAIGLELGPIYPDWDCTSDGVFSNANQAIENIQSNGGVVRYLSMDEPLLYGQLEINGRNCGYDMEETAAVTSRYIERVISAHPRITVGDIEPYPHFSITELEQWILALEDQGVTLAFFHLDVDTERVRVEKPDVAADLQALQRFCREHRIPFGIIVTSNWTASDSNRAYFDSTMEWIHTVNDAIGKPQHVIFQSWQGPAPSGAHEIPINLPQNDPSNYSHMQLIIKGLDVFDP